MNKEGFAIYLITMLFASNVCEASTRASRRKNGQRTDAKIMQSFGGYGGYETHTITTQTAGGASSDPYVTSELSIDVEYVYRVQGKLFAGPLLRMSNNTSGSGDSKTTENEFEPGVIVQYWFEEPNDKSFVPFVWGGFRYSNSSSGSGDSKYSRSGLTYGGGGGGYLMLAENIAITPLFEYSMGSHNSQSGDYSATANYSTMQFMVGLAFLK